MNFAEAIADNPPRLVVLFRQGPDGSEQFQWGVVGKAPVLSLIGGILVAQADLLRDEWVPECTNEEPAFALLWDAADRTTSHYLHPLIPRVPLVGMLETIKAMLVDSRLAQHVAAQSLIVGLDGRPMRQ